MDDNGRITRNQILAWKRTGIEPWARAKVSDERVLGMMVSQYLSGNTNAVLRAVYAALEDVNCHDLNREIQRRFPKAFRMSKKDIQDNEFVGFLHGKRELY